MLEWTTLVVAAIAAIASSFAAVRQWRNWAVDRQVRRFDESLTRALSPDPRTASVGKAQVAGMVERGDMPQADSGYVRDTFETLVESRWLAGAGSADSAARLDEAGLDETRPQVAEPQRARALEAGPHPPGNDVYRVEVGMDGLVTREQVGAARVIVALDKVEGKVTADWIARVAAATFSPQASAVHGVRNTSSEPAVYVVAPSAPSAPPQ